MRRSVEGSIVLTWHIAQMHRESLGIDVGRCIIMSVRRRDSWMLTSPGPRGACFPSHSRSLFIVLFYAFELGVDKSEMFRFAEVERSRNVSDRERRIR